MDHKDIISLYRDYFTKLLEGMKSRIDQDGPLSSDKVANFQKMKATAEELIADKVDDVMEQLGLDHTEEEALWHGEIQKVLESAGIDLSSNTPDSAKVKAQYKFALQSYVDDVLAYNASATDYRTFGNASAQQGNHINTHNLDGKLSVAIESYLREKARGAGVESNKEQQTIQILVDIFGADFHISKLDGKRAREVKEVLQGLPANRNKAKLTQDLPIRAQVAIAKENGLELLGTTTINKYIGYCGAFCQWAHNHQLMHDNPFKGMKLVRKHGAETRLPFERKEIAHIMEALDSDILPKKNRETLYWGILIAIYTGARLNEIASLLPDDVKQHPESGIWYFDITDEEESKQVKTEAAKRYIPVHSALIELGFLDFVEQSRAFAKRRPKQGEYPTRLLHGLTYNQNSKWGRKLGRFVNETLLPKLGLHEKNKKVFHSFRHSFITYLNASGVPLDTTQAIVGHEPDTVTRKVYTHHSLEALPAHKAAIERLVY